MTRRLVALGDSFSCGVGVGVELPLRETWVGLIGAALGAEVELLASPGMASGEVLRDQVPDAVRDPGDVATLLVGLNDIVRAKFDPVATRANVHAIVSGLCAAYPVVLVARLHDAVALLPLPRAMRRRYVQRIADVNAALEEAVARHANCALFDLDDVPALRARCAWAVDRIHPSRYGHHTIAAAALAGLPSALRPALAPVAVPETPPSLRDELSWFLASGGPWLAGRLPKVVYGRPDARRRVVAARRREIGVGEPRLRRRVPGGEQVVHR